MPPERKFISAEQLFKLAALHCTVKEAAGWFKVSESNLHIRMKEEPLLREAWEQGKADGKGRLRALQWQQAEHSVPMAIFLGKNYLGQRNEPKVADTSEPEQKQLGSGADPSRLTTAELQQLHALIAKAEGQPSAPPHPDDTDTDTDTPVNNDRRLVLVRAS